MLRGRESLIRLIGKRRPTATISISHLLNQNPNPVSITATTTTSNNNAINNDFIGPEQIKSELDLFSCPVCATSIRGTHYSVNSHLDICLERGTKRKLTQPTLLHFMSPPNAHLSTNTHMLYASTTSSNLQPNHEDFISVDENECTSPTLSETCHQPFLLETSFQGNSSTVKGVNLITHAVAEKAAAANATDSKPGSIILKATKTMAERDCRKEIKDLAN